MTTQYLAVLDTMWGDRAGQAPAYFRINPHNHSGRRLYWLVGTAGRLLVTNCCRELVTHASQHGRPDPVWLGQCIERWLARVVKGKPATIIVCGRVSRTTFAALPRLTAKVRVVDIAHPAARAWSRDQLEAARRLVQDLP